MLQHLLWYALVFRNIFILNRLSVNYLSTGLTFDIDINWRAVVWISFGEFAEVPPRVIGSQVFDCESDAVIGTSGFTPLHLHPLRWDWSLCIPKRPLQTALPSARGQWGTVLEMVIFTHWLRSLNLFLVKVSQLAAGLSVFSAQWRLLSPSGVSGLMFILSLFGVDLESPDTLNFHMGTCFFWKMCSANTFFPPRTHFKTLSLKGIPEEHRTCLAYHCLCLQKFWVTQPLVLSWWPKTSLLIGKRYIRRTLIPVHSLQACKMMQLPFSFKIWMNHMGPTIPKGNSNRLINVDHHRGFLSRIVLASCGLRPRHVSFIFLLAFVYRSNTRV